MIQRHFEELPFNIKDQQNRRFFPSILERMNLVFLWNQRANWKYRFYNTGRFLQCTLLCAVRSSFGTNEFLETWHIFCV